MIPMPPNTHTPVWSIIFRDAGHINGIILELVFLDLGLKVLRLGPAGPRPSPMAPFALQLLLLGLPMFYRCAHIVVLAQLQEPPVALLILPVCQDLEESAVPSGSVPSAGQGQTRGSPSVGRSQTESPSLTQRGRPQHLCLGLQDAKAAAGRGQ